MATVDDKVVAMSFESSKFESGVNSVISALDKLKAALKFPEAGKGLDSINSSASKVDLSHIGKAVDDIKGKFSAVSVAAIAAFTTVTLKAASAATQVIKSFTLQPILDGFKEYETNLNAIQTVLSNTKAAGTTLDDVNKALQDLNTYSDKTIYNFSQMAKNIGTFTAAGVDLKTSTESIKGIANLAALSGSNADQASTAMYQLSQAISAGRVSLQDWNSVVNAGMGGTVFQRALAQTAEQMGTLKDGSVKLSGAMKNVTIDGQSFRQSLSAGPGKDSWLTSDVLTKTLSQFSGDLTDAQLKAEGFNDAEIKAIQTQAKMALNAATQVKTFSQLLDTTKEAIGSGWAQTWQIIFGDFGEARTLFTGISKALNGWISDSSNARNKVLADWKALGGRTILLDGISQAFKAIGAVLGTVKDAFRDIFPAKTGKDLLDLTVKFHAFAEAMQPSPETLDKLQRTFKGLFAVLDIGKQIVSGIFSVIGDLFGAIGKGSGGFLDITAAIGDFLVKLDDAIKKGDGLTTFFTGLGAVLAAPIRLLGQLRSAIANIFTGGDANASGGFADALVNSMTKGLNAVVDLFKNLGPAIAKAISSINFNTVFLALNTGLIAGIFLVVKKFLGHGFADALGGIGGGILKNISGSFAALTGSLKALQTNIQAGTLQKIAISVALLAAAVLALSLIDPKKLNSALTAMTVGFGELLGAMKILTTISSTAGFVKVPVIAASLILLAAAVDLLVLAVVGLSMLNWEQLAKGLIGVGALLASLSIAAGPLSKNSTGMISAGVGITAMAVGIKILASAIKDFGGMSWATIGKGIGAVAGALVILGLAARAFPPGMVVIGAGLIAVSIGLKLLGSAVSQFGGMDWSTIGKGILGIAGALVIIAGAMQIMPKGMVVQAAALIGVAFALQLIARAVTSFGGMSITEIAKGLGTLAGSLVILAAAMMIMQGSIAGAAALTIAAAGLALLVPPLIALGQQSVGTIAKALIGLALAFAILGAAAILLEPAAPALLAFGVALIAIGAALALAGAGIALIGLGLSSIAVAGPTAVSILIHALTDLAAAGPKLVVSLADSLLSLIDRLAEIAPKFVDAIVKILNSLIDAIIIMAPKIVEAFGVILQNVLLLLRSNFPMFIQTGLDMLIALLNGIKNNIGQVVSTVVTVVITLLSAIAGQLGRIITAGAEILQAVVSGILSGIGSVISSAVNIVTKFIQSIASNIGRIVSAGVSIVTNLIEGIASLYTRIISAGITAMTHFITGIGNKAGDLIKAGTSAAGKFINALVSGVLQLVDEGARAVIRFLNGIADAINKYEPQMIAAGANIGKAIVTGMISGVGALAGQLLAKVKSLISSLPGAAKKLLHISSPSTIFAEIGENMMLGLILGIDKNADAVNSSIEDATNGMIATMADTATAVSDSLASLVDTEPVITPVLDLSQLESDAQQIGGIFNVVPITAATSSGQATAISASQSAQTPSDEIPGTPGSPSFMFEQNNYSPESLSEVEIYRQTKNQLAQVKVALDMV